MAIKMVREPSETPNINNIDDIVPMRYAYGGQNGFVIGKGNEISNSVSGLNFTVNSGRLVLQGVECDIDATGVTITIDNIATKRYYTIYLEVNLGLNTTTIKNEYDTATYPTIDAGDDLTENTTGIARLPLYQFTATNGIISEVNKVVESIKYTSDMSVANANLIQNVDMSADTKATFGNYTVSKRQLLWSGNLRSDSNSLTEFNVISDITFNKGDTIEIEYELAGAGLVGTPTQYYKFHIDDGILQDASRYIEFARGSNLFVFAIQTRITTNEFAVSGGVKLLGNTNVGSNPFVKAIYKIIE